MDYRVAVWTHILESIYQQIFARINSKKTLYLDIFHAVYLYLFNDHY